jgi:hypothetical protein
MFALPGVIGSTASSRAGPISVATTEQEIERLVDEISRAIQRSPVDQRHELRSYASSLISDIATAPSVQTSQTSAPTERRPFGLVAAGLALLIIGAGFALMIPPIGLTLIALGVVLAIWGGIAGWWMTRG